MQQRILSDQNQPHSFPNFQKPRAEAVIAPRLSLTFQTEITSSKLPATALDHQNPLKFQAKIDF
jgi:hypothetical protein